MHKIYEETARLRLWPVIRSGVCPLDGRFEILHCVCENAAKPQATVEGVGFVILRTRLKGKPHRQVVSLFAYKMQEAHFCVSFHGSPMQGTSCSGVFYGLQVQETRGTVVRAAARNFR